MGSIQSRAKHEKNRASSESIFMPSLRKISFFGFLISILWLNLQTPALSDDKPAKASSPAKEDKPTPQYTDAQFNIAPVDTVEGLSESRKDGVNQELLDALISGSNLNKTEKNSTTDTKTPAKKSAKPAANSKKNPAPKSKTSKQTKSQSQPAEASSHLAQPVSENFQKGLTYQSINMLPQAIESYRKAIEEEPKFVSAYNNLAQCLINRGHDGDLKEAEILLGKALSLDPKNVGCIHVRGVLKEAQKDVSGAELAYKQILALQPLNFQAVQNLSVLYFREGKKKEARLVLEEALKNNPPDSHKSIYEQAIENLDKADKKATEK